MDCSGIASDEDKLYTIDSNDALKFYLVRRQTDCEGDNFFHPDMSHQIFGEGEQIYGYKDLEVKIFVSAGRLNFYVDIQHNGMKQSSTRHDMKPDEILPPIASLLPPNTLLDNKDTFLSMVKKELTFRPYGELLHQYKRTEPTKRTFEVYFSSIFTPGFIDYFERLQMFTMFYIDAASYIDVEDQKWKFFTVYEVFESPEGHTQYSVVGITTVYEFYSYPCNIRPRISQMLILPPFQRLGIGSALMETIYKKYTIDPKVTTLAVEDPSPVFSSLRLVIDCRNCMELPEFQPSILKKGITKAHYEVTKSKLKLNKDCTRNVFNVLRLRCTNRKSAHEYKTFRLYIKNQLYSHYRRQDKQAAELTKRHVSKDEIEEILSYVPKEKRPPIIHQEFLDWEARMMEIVMKLPRYH